jgi:hypothetical protein
MTRAAVLRTLLATAAGVLLLCPAAGAQQGKPRPSAVGLKAERQQDRRADARGRYAFELSGAVVPTMAREDGAFLVFDPGVTDRALARRVPSAQACAGDARIIIERRTRRRGRARMVPVLRSTLSVDPQTCAWKATFRTTRRATRFRVRVSFRGNGVFAARDSRSLTLRSGRR